MPVARWVVFDTNIYVAAPREGLGGNTFERLGEAAPRTFLVSVRRQPHEADWPVIFAPRAGTCHETIVAMRSSVRDYPGR